jgi:hypothetical protein
MGIGFECDVCGSTVHLSSNRPELIKLKEKNYCLACQKNVWQIEKGAEKTKMKVFETENISTAAINQMNEHIKIFISNREVVSTNLVQMAHKIYYYVVYKR